MTCSRAVHISSHLATIGQLQVTNSSYWWNHLSWEFLAKYNELSVVENHSWIMKTSTNNLLKRCEEKQMSWKCTLLTLFLIQNRNDAGELLIKWNLVLIYNGRNFLFYCFRVEWFWCFGNILPAFCLLLIGQGSISRALIGYQGHQSLSIGRVLWECKVSKQGIKNRKSMKQYF